MTRRKRKPQRRPRTALSGSDAARHVRSPEHGRSAACEAQDARAGLQQPVRGLRAARPQKGAEHDRDAHTLSARHLHEQLVELGRKAARDEWAEHGEDLAQVVMSPCATKWSREAFLARLLESDRLFTYGEWRVFAPAYRDELHRLAEAAKGEP